jgi:hypothetical protein
MCTGFLLNGADVWATYRLALESWDGAYDEPAATWVQQPLIGRAGAALLDPAARVATRPVTLVGVLRGTDAADARTKLGLLKAALGGAAPVRLTTPDLPTRELWAYRGTCAVREAPAWQRDLTVTIALTALDPWWRGTSDTVVAGIGATPVALPLGDAPVRPELTWVGAATDPVITVRSGRDALPAYRMTAGATSAYPNPENLIAYSEALDNGAWLAQNVTVAADAAVLATGGQLAEQLTVTGTPDAGLFYTTPALVANQRYIGAFDVRGGTAAWAWLGLLENGTWHRAWVNLATGAVGTQASCTASVTAVTGPDGQVWYRVTVACTALSIGNIEKKWSLGLSDADNSTAVTNGKTAFVARAQFARARAVLATLGLTTTIVAADRLVVDCDACTVSLNGASSANLLTSGDFFALDPATDADLAGASWPTLEVSSGTLAAKYRKRWR